jgi:hypothetical protein
VDRVEELLLCGLRDVVFDVAPMAPLPVTEVM